MCIYPSNIFMVTVNLDINIYSMYIVNLVFCILCKCDVFYHSPKTVFIAVVLEGNVCEIWKQKGIYTINICCATHALFVYKKVDLIYKWNTVYWREKEDEVWSSDYLDLHVHLYPQFFNLVFVLFFRVGFILSANVCLRWVNFPYFCPWNVAWCKCETSLEFWLQLVCILNIVSVILTIDCFNNTVWHICSSVS